MTHYARIEVEHCTHRHVVFCDTGYLFSGIRRVIGLRCKNCGTEWDVRLKSFSDDARICVRLRSDAK